MAEKRINPTWLIIRNALILTLITLIAGLSLAAVYQVTKDPIARAEAEAELNAYRAVFPEADAFEKQEVLPTEIPNKVRIDAVAKAAASDGSLLGYALKVTSPNGYGGDVTIAMGVSPDGSLTGISIISQGETAGLGANCTKPAFTEQFKGITGGKVVYTKTGRTEPNEIDAISGATITTKAVTEAVNAGLAYVIDTLGVGAQEGGV